MTDDLLKRLLQPPFGTETSERNLMAEAAAQLEAANARADRARDAALVEAWDCIGHITQSEDRDAIHALRTQPTAKPSVEPVTVQEALEFYANKRNWVSTDPYLDAATDDDEGAKARAALRAIAGEKP